MSCPPGAGIAEAAAGGVRGKEGDVMPGFDGRGPIGTGPMTGGGRGFCNPARYGVRPLYGRGMGRGRGAASRMPWGLGFGKGYWAGAYYPDGGYGFQGPDKEAEFLLRESDRLKKELEAIEGRLSELDSDAARS